MPEASISEGDRTANMHAGGSSRRNQLIISADGYESIEVPVRVFSNWGTLKDGYLVQTGRFFGINNHPTHNRIRFHRGRWTLLNQTHQVGEIIVIDDGSTDRTVEILSPQYPSVRFIQQTKLGVSIARNAGITHARYPWVGFLDSDDKWETTKIEKQASHLTQNLGLKAIHTGEKWIRNGQQVNTPAFLDKSMQGLFEPVLKDVSSPIFCCSSFFGFRKN